MTTLLASPTEWVPVHDANPLGRRLYQRHYSHRQYRDGRRPKKFMGPGYILCLVTPDGLAVFGWRMFVEIGHEFPMGVCCSIFRNEGPRLSSELILEAEAFVPGKFQQHRPFEIWRGRGFGELPFWESWRGAHQRHYTDNIRLYTYVNPKKIASSNPGYCFQMAGWRKVRTTKGGLIELEKYIEP